MYTSSPHVVPTDGERHMHPDLPLYTQVQEPAGEAPCIRDDRLLEGRTESKRSAYQGSGRTRRRRRGTEDQPLHSFEIRNARCAE